MGTTVGQSRKDTGATDISIKLFVMVWVETAECPLSLFLFVCFDKHLTEFFSVFPLVSGSRIQNNKADSR